MRLVTFLKTLLKRKEQTGVTIDLRLLENPDAKHTVFIGLANGERAREFFNVDSSPGPITLLMKSNSIFSSSFIRGLLNKEIQELDLDDFFDHVDISQNVERQRIQLRSYVRRVKQRLL